MCISVEMSSLHLQLMCAIVPEVAIYVLFCSLQWVFFCCNILLKRTFCLFNNLTHRIVMNPDGECVLYQSFRIYHKNLIIKRTILTIIMSLKFGGTRYIRELLSHVTCV